MQAERREAWSTRHTADTQEPQRTRDTAGALRWLQCTAGVASLPADIPFVFRHWSADDASPWHQYILQYRTEYTYRRLGVHRGAHTSDSRTTRLRLRDSSARYSADNVTDSQTLTTGQRAQSEPAVKSIGRTGYRSAPASIGQQHAKLVDDESNVTIMPVSLQHSAVDQQLPVAKSLLRCPAIRIHLNSSSVSSSAAAAAAAAAQGGGVTTQAPSSLPAGTNTTSNLHVLPRVVTECCNTDSRTHHHHHHHQQQQQQQQQPLSSAVTSDSHSTLSGRTMRPVPSNGFSIDDRAMLVTSLSLHFITALHGMQARSSDENSVCPSVRLSVRPSVIRVHCDKTEERSVQIFTPYER